jgi:hypothetical protein
VESSVWLSKDRLKRVQLRIFPQEAYELRFISGPETQGCCDISPEDFRAVLHDYFRFNSNGVSLSYENRYVEVRIMGKCWGAVPDVDLMRLENMALSGEGGSFDSLS